MSFGVGSILRKLSQSLPSRFKSVSIGAGSHTESNSSNSDTLPLSRKNIKIHLGWKTPENRWLTWVKDSESLSDSNGDIPELSREDIGFELTPSDASKQQTLSATLRFSSQK